MIYFCIPTYNDAATIGLVLWKVRQVFSAFPREYHFLVANDGSTDGTGEVLERYQRHLFYYRKQNGEPLSFDAPEMGGQEVIIDAAHVRDRLSSIVNNEDLSRYIL